MANRAILEPLDWFDASISCASFGVSLPLPTIPESVSESINLNTSEQEILGRSAPIISYSSTGARKISFTIALVDDYMPTGYNIVSYINALKSLEYPNYTSNNLIPPSVVIKLGAINAQGIINSVSINWKGPLSNLISGGTYRGADVSISFTEVREAAKGTFEIRNGN